MFLQRVTAFQFALMDARFLRSNLLILFAYAVLVNVFALLDGGEPAMTVFMGMMLLVFLHVLVLFIGMVVNFFRGFRRLAGQWALNMLLVAIIGFGTCLGGGALMERITQDNRNMFAPEQAP